jgi:hypothetical protein
VYSRADCVFIFESLFELLTKLGELKHNIEQTVATKDPETLRTVARNTRERVYACF